MQAALGAAFLNQPQEKDMDDRYDSLAMSLAKLVLRVLRFVFYISWLIVGRIVEPIARLVMGCGLVVFAFCAWLRPDLSAVIWASIWAVVGAGLVSGIYFAVLRWVAPDGVVIVSEL
jgi:hypothetical protein